MDRKETDLRVVQEEPTVEPAGSEVDLNVFFKWDDLSTRLASSGQMNPPWFRIKGLDDGEVRLFTPLPSTPPADFEGTPDEYEAKRWDAEGVKLAKVIGPTKGMIDKLIAATTDQEAENAAVDLIEECLQALPDGFTLKRPFTIGEQKILSVGDQYPAPWQVREMTVEGLQKSELVSQYILKCLPKSVRDMVHTASLCMAVPETDFMVATGQEKGSTERATMLKHPQAKPAGEEEDFGEGFSSDSEEK